MDLEACQIPLSNQPYPPKGRLWKRDLDRNVIPDGIHCSNGIWRFPDNKHMYSNDSCSPGGSTSTPRPRPELSAAVSTLWALGNPVILNSRRRPAQRGPGEVLCTTAKSVSRDTSLPSDPSRVFRCTNPVEVVYCVCGRISFERNLLHSQGRARFLPLGHKLRCDSVRASLAIANNTYVRIYRSVLHH